MKELNDQPTSGWVTHISSAVKAEFRRLYPARSAMKAVTLEAVKGAIIAHPDNAHLRTDAAITDYFYQLELTFHREDSTK